MREQAGDTQKIEVVLDRDERDLVLHHGEAVDPDVCSKLVFGLQQGDLLSYRLSVEDTILLLHGIAEDAKTARTVVLRARFDALLLRLTEVLEPVLKEVLPRPGGRPPLSGSVRVEVERYLAEHPDASMDEVSAHVRSTMADYNRSPQVELLGFTPMELACLLYSPAETVLLNDELPDAAVAGVEAVVKGRTFLRLVAEAPVKLTTSGFMNLTAVRRIGQAVYPEAIEACERDGLKRITEEHMSRFNLLRIALQEGGLLEEERNHLHITAAGRMALEPGQGASMLVAMFEALFHEIDPGYLARMETWEELDDSAYVAIAAIGRHCRDWVDVRMVHERAILPAMMDTAPFEMWGHIDIDIYFSRAIMTPLSMLGLLEHGEFDVPDQPGEVEYGVRVTPLWDQLFTFHYDEENLATAGYDPPETDDEGDE